jgi:pimeloyl-ACP methyl ester carboxylesterase
MPSIVESVALSTGVTLPYVEQGEQSGVPVILLHGPTDSWRSFEILLAQLPASVRAFALSQRGHGDADRPELGYRPEDFAGDVVAFMNTVGLESAVLAGHSGAGFTARRVALDHPDRVLGLVLIAAPQSLRDNTDFRDFLQTVSKLTDPVDPDFVREFVRSTVTQPVSFAFLETAITECCKVPARVWQATLSGLLEGDVPPTRESASVPALLIWGDQDEICPLSQQQALMAAIPDASLAIYHGAGHSPHWEQPQRSAADIAAFAERVGRTDTA